MLPFVFIRWMTSSFLSMLEQWLVISMNMCVWSDIKWIIDANAWGVQIFNTLFLIGVRKVNWTGHDLWIKLIRSIIAKSCGQENLFYFFKFKEIWIKYHLILHSKMTYDTSVVLCMWLIVNNIPLFIYFLHINSFMHIWFVSNICSFFPIYALFNSSSNNNHIVFI